MKKYFLIVLFTIPLFLLGCGGGSSDSGGGFSLAPGDTIQKDVHSTITQTGGGFSLAPGDTIQKDGRFTITQSGSYGLPDVFRFMLPEI